MLVDILLTYTKNSKFIAEAAELIHALKPKWINQLVENLQKEKRVM